MTRMFSTSEPRNIPAAKSIWPSVRDCQYSDIHCIVRISLTRGACLQLAKLLPNVIHAMNKRPNRTDGKDPKHLWHSVEKEVIGVPVPRRKCTDDQQHDPFRPLKKSDVCLYPEAFTSSRRVTDHHRRDHPDA